MIASLFGLENRTLVVTGVDVRNDAALNAVFGQSGATVAKINVTETTAQTFSAVYACVRLISTTVGHLPYNIYERIDDEGDKKIARDHDLYDMLRLQPNHEMTAIFMRQSAMAYTLLWGRHYSYIERSSGGNIVGLWPMRTGDIKRIRVNGSTYYDVTKVEDNDLYPKPPLKSKTLNKNEVIELTTFDGESIVSHAREQIGEAIAAQQFGSGFYAGGAQPYLYIRHPGVLTDPDKLRNNWQAIHSGKERKVAVLEEGMEVGTIGMPLEDAQFLESREFYVTDIARWFGVPPHKIADLKRATFSNIEEQNLEWRESLLPWLEMIEQEHETKIFTPPERKRYFLEHNTDELLRGNITARYAAHASAIQWGWKNRNEVRRTENLNGVDGLDEYLAPSNMMTAEQMENGANQNQPIQNVNQNQDSEVMDGKTNGDSDMMKNAARSALDTVLKRLLERELTEVRKAAKERKNFVEWLDGFYEKWPEKMQTALRPAEAACRTMGNLCSIPVDAIITHCQASKQKALEISGSAKADELFDKIESKFIVTEIEVQT